MDYDTVTSGFWTTVFIGGVVVFVYFTYREHKRRELRKAGGLLISELLKAYFQGNIAAHELGRRTQEIANQNFLDPTELHSLISATFERAVEESLALPVCKERESNLVNLVRPLQKEFALTGVDVRNLIEQIGHKEISQLFNVYAQNNISADRLAGSAREIADRLSLSSAGLHFLIKGRFQSLVDKTVEQLVSSRDDEKNLFDLLATLKKEFTLTDADFADSIERITKGSILRDLDTGVIHQFPVESLSIMLLKDELVVWLFKNAQLYQLKSHSSYVGSSQGVSIRIARGLYYRVGAFEGHRVQTENLEFQETGELVATDHNVYFSGNKRSLRIPLQKIVSVHGYSDGIGLVREASNPKPLVFVFDDPWFASNLILSKRRSNNPSLKRPGNPVAPE